MVKTGQKGGIHVMRGIVPEPGLTPVLTSGCHGEGALFCQGYFMNFKGRQVLPCILVPERLESTCGFLVLSIFHEFSEHPCLQERGWRENKAGPHPRRGINLTFLLRASKCSSIL